MERRLAAILAADVAGYTALMGADEAGTLRHLTELRRDFLEPLIGEHHGRIVKLMGDGFLVEFASVVDAVACALAWQYGVGEREAAASEDKRLQFRIGINLGDVIVEGSDIHGDGVNIAARLEGLAEPGGICVSDDTYRQARGKTKAAFEDLGEQALKNVAEPIRVYRVAGHSAGTPRPAPARIPPALSDRPSLAVLPFINMSGDPEQEYFADGITEDIITELSRFHSLFVIARKSSFHYKGRSPKIKDVGRELGVQYVVEGSVRKAGKRVRITAQLIEANSGNNLWAERFDRDLENIFKVQDEVTRAVVSTVVGRIDSVAQRRSAKMRPDELRAYDLILRAKFVMYRFNATDNAEARHLLERAIELDPISSQARAVLALAHLLDWVSYWVEDRTASLSQALRFAKEAVALDDADCRSQWGLGEVYIYARDYDKAKYHLEKAVRLNPNDVEAHAVYGLFLALTGETESALTEFELALQIDPNDLNWLPWMQGQAQFASRQYNEAIATFERIGDAHNEVRGWLAASYAYAGRYEEAKAMLEVFIANCEKELVGFPGRSAAGLREYWYSIAAFKHEVDLQHLLDGLAKAGLED